MNDSYFGTPTSECVLVCPCVFLRCSVPLFCVSDIIQKAFKHYMYTYLSYFWGGTAIALQLLYCPTRQWDPRAAAQNTRSPPAYMPKDLGTVASPPAQLAVCPTQSTGSGVVQLLLPCLLRRLIPILWLGLLALLRLLLLRGEGWALSPRQPLVLVLVPLVRPRVGPHQDEPTVVPEGPNEVRLRILQDLCATPHGVVVTDHLEVRYCQRRPLRGRLLRRCLHRRRRIAASALGWLSPRRHYIRTLRDAASAARASVLRWC